MGKNTERMERMERMTGILRKMRDSFRVCLGKNEPSKYKGYSLLSYLYIGGCVFLLKHMILSDSLSRARGRKELIDTKKPSVRQH